MKLVTIENLHCLNRQVEQLSKNRNNLRKSTKTRQKGLISVVFLTWERDAYIRIALESFKKFVDIHEKDVKFEMISMDNGSKNKNIHKILSDYKWDLRIESRKNLGICGGLTRAYSESNGEFVICLEDDWETMATRPLFGPSIRIMREFEDIGGIRHRERVQNFITKKTHGDDKTCIAQFDSDGLAKAGIPWRGKYRRRRWFDQRFTSSGETFYTWANPSPWVPSVYCNPCFLMRGNAFDAIEPMKTEAAYSHVFGSYYNAAILVDETKFVHRGKTRQKGTWHE